MGNTDEEKLVQEQSKLTREWIKSNIKEKGVSGLSAEFNNCKKPLKQEDCAVFLKQPAGTKNRYRDVVCLDKTRIVLKNEKDDYIHANYVSTPLDPKRFICTQGPTDVSCSDFWCMIFQEQSTVILMLCNMFEKGMKKCADYYPQNVNESVSFEGSHKYKITCTKQYYLETSTENKIKISILSCTKDDKEKLTVEHFQWVDWPDRGVPTGDLTAISLLQKATDMANKKPITVHCSAGIGRTGSIVMIQYIVEQYRLGKSFTNLDQILLKIRDQRALSVQNEVQYLYVVRVIVEFLCKSRFTLSAEEAKDLMGHVKTFLREYKSCEGK